MSKTASATATGADSTDVAATGLAGATGTPDSAAGVLSPFLGFGQSYSLLLVFVSVFGVFAIVL
jgi:hypothetical protein